MSEASALGATANPLVCISTAPFIPAIQSPATMPMRAARVCKSTAMALDISSTQISS